MEGYEDKLSVWIEETLKLSDLNVLNNFDLKLTLPDFMNPKKNKNSLPCEYTSDTLLSCFYGDQNEIYVSTHVKYNNFNELKTLIQEFKVCNYF